VRDYPSLFKPAVLALRPGGSVLATNHVSTVDMEPWLESLERCASKAGRPLVSLTPLTPEADFPSPDGKHPLKMAIATVH
jgi:23S rRNA (cytosine1962-C5)-methyltransferase